ncbi:FAD-binding oxidoreductase [Chryseosolibacter indicus]|uniref:FAD-binding oxidoreductase n=1 Tax=Chryseosolibacter indicus TaxID=2782351 RepID=A0ABS5VRE6_9BACT|nr:FAD-binding oxidoreductase [Chryseosolibacter indicus]MBT1702586.1 FAD-binding oxidoreductase [Chryseosolibacter indicus]
MKKLVTNWNNYPVVEADEITFEYGGELTYKLNGHPTIAHGNGRCYGDASLSESVISTLRFNKILSFDLNEGVVICQSGVLLSELLQIIVPHGWFLPVTPGTKFITIGGAVASDIHGKNHHVDGSFSRHMQWMNVLTGTGQTLTASRHENEDLFWATCGGMGLTGVILEVCFQLKKINTSYIRQKQIKAENLDEVMVLFAEHSDYTYSVAWIDCLKSGDQFGRSILMLGEHATAEELGTKKEKLSPKEKAILSVPFHFPSFVLNELSVKAFNAMYYAKNYRKIMDSIVHYDGFFYPLDSIMNWNRIYGRKGFVQYQFVLPLKESKEGLKNIIKRISKMGMGSFLAVLKLFGEQDDLISFPMEGYTLALDFPMRPGLAEFLDDLDEVVADYGGRIYLSKDARMKKEVFWDTYANAPQFKEILKKYDPDNRFVSELSKRLKLKD